MELLGRQDVTLLLGLGRDGESEAGRGHPLVRRAVVPGVVEGAVADVEEHPEELLDSLPVERRPRLCVR